MLFDTNHSSAVCEADASNSCRRDTAGRFRAIGTNRTTRLVGRTRCAQGMLDSDESVLRKSSSHGAQIALLAGCCENRLQHNEQIGIRQNADKLSIVHNRDGANTVIDH